VHKLVVAKTFNIKIGWGKKFGKILIIYQIRQHFPPVLDVFENLIVYDDNQQQAEDGHEQSFRTQQIHYATTLMQCTRQFYIYTHDMKHSVLQLNHYQIVYLFHLVLHLQ